MIINTKTTQDIVNEYNKHDHILTEWVSLEDLKSLISSNDKENKIICDMKTILLRNI